MGVKRSIWFKSLATFLAFIIVIQLLPLSVLAENITQSSASDISNEQNMEVVGEVVDKRTEYQDGTYYEITSSLPIHEKSGSEWVEPDISEDEPETTQEAEDYVKDLSENISESTNDEYGIAPASIDIVDPTEPVLPFNIVSATSNHLSNLNQNNLMLVRTPQLTQNSSVYAQATISCKIKVNYQNRSSGYVYAYQMKNDCDVTSNSLTKSDLEYYENILDFQEITSSGYNYWDITDTYLKWEKGICDNYGIAFAPKGKCNFTIEQCSMVRQYKVIDMYDSDFTYHSIDMGRAGTVYINDFTNTVLIKRDELSIDGNILPVDLVRYIDLNGNSSVGNPYGKDTRYNYESGIRMVTSYTYAWDSFDGETVYFTPSYFNPNGSYIDWNDTSGYGYEMRIFAAGINGTDFSQTILKNEEEGITYSFNNIGKIIKITKGSDSIEIVYTKNKTVNIDNDELSVPDGLIDYIQDGSGRRYYFNYNPEKSYDELNQIFKAIGIFQEIFVMPEPDLVYARKRFGESLVEKHIFVIFVQKRMHGGHVVFGKFKGSAEPRRLREVLEIRSERKRRTRPHFVKIRHVQVAESVELRQHFKHQPRIVCKFFIRYFLFVELRIEKQITGVDPHRHGHSVRLSFIEKGVGFLYHRVVFAVIERRMQFFDIRRIGTFKIFHFFSYNNVVWI